MRDMSPCIPAREGDGETPLSLDVHLTDGHWVDPHERATIRRLGATPFRVARYGEDGGTAANTELEETIDG